MKVLLFGSSGLLGVELTSALLRAGHEVISPRHGEIDLTDFASLVAYIRLQQPSFIINAAAHVQVNEIEKDPIPAWQLNAVAPGVVSRALQEFSIRVPYVHISTSYVFGNSSTPHTEEESLLPLNTYGATKALGEELVSHYSTLSGNPYYIVRLSWIFGTARPTFVDEVAKAFLEGKTYLASTDQYGNITSAADVAAAIVRFFVDSTNPSGAYHVVNASDGKRGVSRFEIAQEIAHILNVPESLVIPTSSDAVFATKRPSSMLANTKLPSLCDWRVALREYINAQYGQRSSGSL